MDISTKNVNQPYTLHLCKYLVFKATTINIVINNGKNDNM